MPHYARTAFEIGAHSKRGIEATRNLRWNLSPERVAGGAGGAARPRTGRARTRGDERWAATNDGPLRTMGRYERWATTNDGSRRGGPSGPPACVSYFLVTRI